MPKRATLLAIDYGKARTGLAVGHPLTGSAQPLDPLSSKNESTLVEGLAKVMKTWQPAKLIVGLPLGAEGYESPMSQSVRAFADILIERFPDTEVLLHDERLTSMAAASAHAERREQGRARARDAAKLDSMAAALILESFMNAHPEAL